MTIDSLLKPFQRFGVHLGLERINTLLADLGNPHHHVPIIHVAGTNGKGSVCAYLSTILTEAGYNVGRYTSPHLIDWTERICLNEKPIASEVFAELIQQIQEKIKPETESPTQFEVITAAAFLYFAQSQVDIAVIEVGLGGRLDATNVCEHPLVSIITSLSREHWQVLGATLAAIAGEKAGIIKANCPAVISQLPAEAQAVVKSRVEVLSCPVTWVESAKEFSFQGERWASYEEIQYPLPLLGEVQLINSAIAIATLKTLQKQGWKISESAIQKGMAKARLLGRLQWTKWQDHPLLIDGAHNPASAQALRQYVDTLNQPITWVMGILSTKDHEEIFRALLRSNDRLYLVPVPDHSTAEPEQLASLAQQICPSLQALKTYADVFTALSAAREDQNANERTIVLCGSLYLVGYFLQ